MCIYFSVQRYQNQEITLQSQKWYATEKKKSFNVMTVFFKKNKQQNILSSIMSLAKEYSKI